MPHTARLALALSLASGSLVAQSSAPPSPSGLSRTPGMHFVLEGSFEGGGERILEITFTDGSTQSIYAGQGGTFAVGAEYRLSRVPRLAVAGTIGYKFVTTAAENADIRFTRIPLDLTARWSLTDAWWVAGGLTHHRGIAFDGDGFLPDASLPPATGITAEFGWRWIALTATMITYDNRGADLGANSIGGTVRWVFGDR